MFKKARRAILKQARLLFLPWTSTLSTHTSCRRSLFPHRGPPQRTAQGSSPANEIPLSQPWVLSPRAALMPHSPTPTRPAPHHPLPPSQVHLWQPCTILESSTAHRSSPIHQRGCARRHIVVTDSFSSGWCSNGPAAINTAHPLLAAHHSTPWSAPAQPPTQRMEVGGGSLGLGCALWCWCRSLRGPGHPTCCHPHSAHPRYILYPGERVCRFGGG